jgi:hypothetical protein
MVTGMVADGRIPERRIDESWRRVHALKVAIASRDAVG